MKSFFKTNCRDDWSERYCDLGNVCALFSQVIGFTAILPQIYQVWTYKSVDALHVFWPAALVTAAIANAFYTFATEDRSIFKITAVYYPVVYIIFLLEFWFYTKKSSQRKLSFAALCIIFWGCLLTIELSVSLPEGPEKLEWVAISFYSIKVVPQIMVNTSLRTTFGQSSISILLYCLVSTFSYLSVCLLQENLQYRVMYYLSSSFAYINAIQLLWYPKPTIKKEVPIMYGTIIDSQDYSLPFEDRNAIVRGIGEEVVENPADIEQVSKQISSTESSHGSSAFGRSQTINILSYIKRIKEKTWWQQFLLVYLAIGLLLFVIGLGVTANNLLVIIGPVTMFCLLFFTSLCRDYNEGSLDCFYFTEMRYRIMGESL